MVSKFAKSFVRQVLAAMKAVGGELNGVVMMLFQNNVDMNLPLTMADLVECDYSGYARSAALAWVDPYIDRDTAQYALSAPSGQFRTTDVTPFVGNSVYGFALVKPGAPDELVMVHKFSEELGMTLPDLVLAIRPEIIGTQLVTGQVVIGS